MKGLFQVVFILCWKMCSFEKNNYDSNSYGPENRFVLIGLEVEEWAFNPLDLLETILYAE